MKLIVPKRRDLYRTLVFVVIVLIIVFYFTPKISNAADGLSGTAYAQSTGTLVDPSVPAGVAPNPHTLEGAQIPAAGPTPRRSFKKEKTLPPGNRKNHVVQDSFAAPAESGVKPANANH